MDLDAKDCMRVHSWFLIAITCISGQRLLAQVAPTRLRGNVELTIGGAAETRDSYTFEDIRGLAYDSRGNILVADSRANIVRVFDNKGLYLFGIGRAGAGPGDLRAPCCITVLDGDRLWVQESGNYRFSLFELRPARAVYVRSVRMPKQSVSEGWRLQVDERGQLLYPMWELDAGAGTWRTSATWLDSTGRISQQTQIPEPPADSLGSFLFQQAGGAATYQQPFGPRGLKALGPRGDIAVAVSSRYSIAWLGSDGGVVAKLQKATTEVPLSDREKTAASKTISSIKQRTGGQFPFGVPSHKPPLVDLGFDLDGRLWAERSVGDGQSHEADVYDRAGRLISTVQWPADIRLIQWTCRGDLALGIGTDSLGVQRVVRLRFVRSQI